MNVRFAKDFEKSYIMEIWKNNFNEDDIYLDFWFGNYYNPKNTVVCEKNNKICGAVHFIECYLSKEKSAYICGLSVNKEQRGENIASKMLEFLHNYLKEQGYSYCFLMPSISESFYIKFGYFKIAEGIDRIITQNFCEPFDVYYGDEINIYNKYCEEFDVSIKRNREYFDMIGSMYKKYNGGILSVKQNGKEIGYFIYGIENEIPVIYESVFLTGDGDAFIWNYFKRDVKEKRLPVMIKSLCNEFDYKKSLIFMH